MKKKRQYVLGVGYPWYNYEKGFGNQGEGYYSVSLANGPNRIEGREFVELKLKWGAWKKVRILIEECE